MNNTDLEFFDAECPICKSKFKTCFSYKNGNGIYFVDQFSDYEIEFAKNNGVIIKTKRSTIIFNLEYFSTFCKCGFSIDRKYFFDDYLQEYLLKRIKKNNK